MTQTSHDESADASTPDPDGGSPDHQQWANQFNVTLDQIRNAVDAVGTNKADVEMYLKGSHSTTDSEITRRAGQ